MIEVVAALIWQNGKFLICQRPEHKPNKLRWEFVGGKVEVGETKEQALERECREELGVEVSVGEEFMDITHTYPDVTIHLTLFCATIKAGAPQMLEHRDMCWISPQETDKYNFCPADKDILAKIKAIK